MDWEEDERVSKTSAKKGRDLSEHKIVTARSRVSRMHPRNQVVLLALAFLILAAASTVVGLSLGGSHTAARTPAPQTSTYVAPAPNTTFVASIVRTTAAYRAPGGTRIAPIASTWHGAHLDLPVIAQHAGYLEVRLPTRPNGSTAWVSRTAVRLFATTYKIVVDLSARHLLLYRDGRLILDAPAGIGTVADPTPTGDFFVAFFAKAPSAAWGPFVMVTSAHSNAISDWEESGDAIVAIHGPLGMDQAIGSLGARISHGCVRLHDVALQQLRAVPDGSPVEIVV